MLNAMLKRAQYPDGVSQRESDSERQSFWNGDDEHGDADDEELDKLLEILHLPCSLAYDERLGTEPQHQDDYRQNCSHCAYISDNGLVVKRDQMIMMMTIIL